MATPGLSELITTTLRYRTPGLRDNISKNTPLFQRLSKQGKIKKIGGGRSIVEPLMHAEVGTFQWYSGYEQVNVSPSETISAAEFDWKQAAAAVTISGLEKRQNSGKEQIIDLLEARVDAAEITITNALDAASWSDGTGTGGKQLGGLQLLVSDSPTTGTVGGINRATHSFWRNVAFDATTDGGAAATAANIQGYMNRLWIQLVRNNDKPDLILADNNYWRLYLESLQSIQRITSDEMASAGFDSLKYMSADVVLAGGYGGACPTNHMYFLNTKYLKLVVHSDMFMDPIDPETRAPVNQDAIVKLIGFMGALTMSCGFLHGVLKD